ncbi:hypothetical protein ABZT27_25940 [Streptomyces sp. NPDC005389]|uniref:hypothetical protein n=1 Tax=Streptomyces sp. NPDC005389 TaxID=3157040 RepID=UPI0033BB86BE
MTSPWSISLRVAFGGSAFLPVPLSAHHSRHDLFLIGRVPRRLRRLFPRTGTPRVFTVVPEGARLGFA